jgi:hypothetical protein
MENMFKINGNPEEFADLGVFHKLSKQFLPYAQERLGFNKPVGINLISDPQNAKNPLGKTAYYNPGNMEVTVFVDNRHIKDILRSMSHELVHHTQNCRGEFDGGIDTGPGYAQEDGHMRKMEEEAYLEGQMLLRDFEDTIKKENKQMSKKLNEKMDTVDQRMAAAGMEWTPEQEKEWQEALEAVQVAMNRYSSLNSQREQAESGGIDIDALKAAAGRMGDVVARSKGRDAAEEMLSTADLEKALGGDEEIQAATGGGKPALEEAEIQNPGKYKTGMKAGYDKDGDGVPDGADKNPKDGAIQEGEESLEEGDGAICEECGGNGLHEKHCNVHRKNESLEEGWSNKKDQLLFERLVNKWIK